MLTSLLLARLTRNITASNITRRHASINIVSATMKYYRNGGMNNDLTEVLNNVLSEQKFNDIPGLPEWIRKLAHYTTVGSKKIRSTVLVSAYNMLEIPEYKSEEKVKLSHVLGVVSELMASHILVLDDMEDGSEFRHNKPCWYRLPGVGLTACIDASLIKCLTFYIVQKYFHDHPNLCKILELLHESYFKTALGQYLDNKTCQAHVTDFTHFTPERYFLITTLKSSPFCIHMPFLMGLALTEKKEIGELSIIERICENIGYLYQSQNDYHDVYENEFNRKEGSDIKDRKCSWVSSTALRHCNPTQRDIFVQNYGTSDPENVKRILYLYDELKIPELFVTDQIKVTQDTEKLINVLQDDCMRLYFRDLVNLVYKDVYHMF